MLRYLRRTLSDTPSHDPAGRSSRRRPNLDWLEERCLLTSTPLPLSVSEPFRVWTQNTQLRPDDIFTTEELILLGPVAWAIEAYYDGLKVPNTSDDNDERADYLLDRIAPFDIIALQEVFDEDNGLQIAAGAQQQGYHDLSGPPETTFEQSSGLVLLVRDSLDGEEAEHAEWPTRFQFYEAEYGHHAEVFENDGPNDEADALAQKGFTIDRVQVGDVADQYVYVVNTHLQAGGNPRERLETRRDQLQQIRDALDRLTDGDHPVVILGDLNIVAGSSQAEYQEMLATLGNPTDIFAGLPVYTQDARRNAYAFNWNDHGRDPDEHTRIDYILIRQGEEYQVVVDDLALEDTPAITQLYLDEGWDDGQHISYLSDHFGLSASLRLVRSIALDGETGELQVQGGSDSSRDTVRIEATASELLVTISGGERHASRRFPLGDVRSIAVQTGDGNDAVSLVNVPPSIPVSIDTGADQDDVHIALAADGASAPLTVMLGDGVDQIVLEHIAAGADVTIDLGGHDDWLTVERVDAGAHVRADGGSGTDSVLITPTSEDLGLIQGTLTLDGGGDPHQDRLIVHDEGHGSTRPGELIYTVTADRLRRARSGTIHYDDLETMDVFSGTSGIRTTVTILGSAAGTSLTLHASHGDDTIVLGDASHTLDEFNGSLSVTGGGGDDQLVINDLTSPSSPTGIPLVLGEYTLREGSLDVMHHYISTYLGFPQVVRRFSFSDLESLELRTGDLVDSIRVLGTSDGVSVAIDAGGGNDTITVGDPIHWLSTLGGPLAVEGGLGSDRLVINDLTVGSSAPFSPLNSYTITGDSVSHSLSTLTQTIHHGGLSHLELNTGGLGDTVTVLGTPAGMTLDLDLGDGHDAVTIGDLGHTLATLAGGLVVIAGGPGTDRLTINDLSVRPSFQLGISTDTYTVSDVSVVHRHTWILSRLSPPQVTMQEIRHGDLESLELKTGGLDDVISLVAPLFSLPLIVDAGGGSDMLAGFNTVNVWNIRASNAGTLNGATVFRRVESLTGGGASDTFLFDRRIGVDGVIDGRGSIDHLDYSRYDSGAPVAVDLRNGTGTGTGALRGVEGVTGGDGDDLLIGDANGNVFRGRGGNDILVGRDGADLINGGSGRDLLIGGAAADNLSGEEGDDVLIGGTTLYTDDTTVNTQALQDLRAEWSRTDQDYRVRTDMLRWGRGLANGSYLRPGQTVFDDASTDLVEGDQDLDWFFALAAEVLDFDPLGREDRES